MSDRFTSFTRTVVRNCLNNCKIFMEYIERRSYQCYISWPMVTQSVCRKTRGILMGLAQVARGSSAAIVRVVSEVRLQHTAVTVIQQSSQRSCHNHRRPSESENTGRRQADMRGPICGKQVTVKISAIRFLTPQEWGILGSVGS